MASRNFAIDGTIGVDLDETYASAGVAPFNSGQCVRTTNGGEWIFVQTEADVSAFMFVAIRSDASASALGSADAVSFTAVGLSTGNAGGAIVGVAQSNIASANLGWIALAGNNIRGRVAISAQPNVPLFTTGTAGVVDDATVSGGHLLNVVALTSAASASAPPIQIAGGIVVDAVVSG